MAKCQVGHKGCTCGMMCCQVTDERGAEIAADARSGRNWAEETKATPVGAYGPTCICGAGERLQRAALAFRGLHGVPTGRCPRHPGGTVARKSEGTRYPGENGA